MELSTYSYQSKVISSFIFTSIIIITALLVNASSVSGQLTGNYISNITGIQLNYPSSWTYYDKTQFPIVSFFPIPANGDFSSPIKPEVSVSVLKDWTVSDKDISLDSYLQLARSNIVSNGYSNLTESEKITLHDDLPAYEWTSNDDKEMVLTIVTISNGVPYKIIYQAPLDIYDHNLLVASAMISSLHFLNSVR